MRFLPDSSTHPSDRPPLPVAPEKVKEDSIYPFKLNEVVFLTENNDYCEQMVRQWIANKGNLQKYYNISMNSKVGIIPAITRESEYQPSFFSLVEQTGKITATNASDMIQKLKQAYGVEGTSGENDYQNIREDEKLITTIVACPRRAMMHFSLRKEPITSGGHAIGIARSDDTYYLFDPNDGMFRIQGKDRLKEVLVAGFADPKPPTPRGSWVSYVYYYSILVANALDASL